MNYRDWPRLLSQLTRTVRSMSAPQARPTEGQLEVLTLVEIAAGERALELTAIVDGVIAELNQLLQDAPKIITDWRRGIS